MGIWSGIKHALNSTLGTENFMPIDEQIANLKTLHASDNVYLEIQGTGVEDLQINNDYTVTINLPVSMKILQSGSIKIMFKTHNQYDHYVRLNIYRNGELYKSSNFSNEGSSSWYENTTEVIYCNRNDVFTFEIKATDFRDVTSTVKYSYLDITNLFILADLKDNVLVIKEV